ncbi:hypothetical protein WA026_022786 [Henosepilachna vigintioctopunctata]|uniref:Uncharacterized protein n=1 Tax=Henosepilachna vigintioctopunctata TaxID=420089 RepID=A0AAW1VFV1_9CUCU
MSGLVYTAIDLLYTLILFGDVLAGGYLRCSALPEVMKFLELFGGEVINTIRIIVVLAITLVNGKRPVEDISTPTEENTETEKQEATGNPFIKPSETPRAKNAKTYKQIDILFKPTKNFIKIHSPPLVLNYNQIKDLFDNVWGSTDPVSVVKNYTNDLLAVVNMLTEIYPHFTERNIKSRSTKLKKKLLKHIEGETTDDLHTDIESDSSQETTN